jgi:hypothetical protein
MPLELRLKMDMPISFSSSLTAFERLGWVMKSCFAASEIEPQFTMVTI